MHHMNPKSSQETDCRSDATAAYTSNYESQYASSDYSSTGLMCGDATRTMLSVVGGAGLGALLMYLLDPDEGPSRRRYVSDTAGSTWEMIRDKAGEWTGAAASGASYLGGRAASGASYLGGRVSDSRVGRRTSRATRNFRDQTSDRFNYLLHGNPRTGPVESGLGQAMAAVGCLALGVGAMYFLDTRDGARRRNVLRDKFLSAFGRMATSLERTGRDLYNRGSGAVREMKAKRSEQFVDDRTLVERVRSQLGHCVSNVSAIEVTATNGRVTLRGSAQGHEVDNLLKCVWATRGVTDLINQLDTSGVRNPGNGGSSTQSANISSSAFASAQPAPLGSSITCPNPT